MKNNIYKYTIWNHNPLSRFPQGGKAGRFTPSPLGEVPIAIGREGDNNYKRNYSIIYYRYSY